MPVTKPTGWDTYIDSNFRKVTMTAEVTYNSPEADPSLSAASSDDYFDTDIQMIDGNTNIASEWIRIEHDTIGSALPIIDFTRQVGVYSDTISDGTTGAINTTAQIEFSSRTIEEFEVNWDNARDEYAIDFTVDYYYGGTWNTEATVTGNTSNSYSLSITRTAVTKIRVVTTKTQALIRLVTAEMSAFKRDELTTDEIVTCSLLEELSPTGSLADFASGISANELQLTYLDPGDLAFGDLKQNSRIVIRYGLWTGSSYVYVDGGVYYSNRWTRDEVNDTVTVLAYDRLSLLSRKQYAPAAEQSKSLDDAVEEVFDDYGWDASRYDISTLGVTIPYLKLDKKSHLNALKNLVGVAQGYAITRRDDIVYILDGTAWSGTADKTLTDSTNIVQYPVDLTSENLITTSAVVGWAEMKIATSATNVIEYTEPFEVDGTETITLFWSGVDTVSAINVTTPSFTQSASGISISSWSAYSWGVSITFTNSGSGSVNTITVSGKAVTRNDLEYTYQDNEDVYGVLEHSYVNSLIQTLAQAKIVGQNIVDKTALPGLIRQIPCIGDPAIIPGDRITYPYQGSTETGTLWRRELTFDGGFKDLWYIKRDV